MHYDYYYAFLIPLKSFCHTQLKVATGYVTETLRGYWIETSDTSLELRRAVHDLSNIIFQNFNLLWPPELNT